MNQAQVNQLEPVVALDSFIALNTIAFYRLLVRIFGKNLLMNLEETPITMKFVIYFCLRKMKKLIKLLMEMKTKILKF